MAKSEAAKIAEIQLVQVDEKTWLCQSTTDKTKKPYELVDEGGRVVCSCPAWGACIHQKALYQLDAFKKRRAELAAIKPVKGPSITKNGYPLDEVTSAMHKEIRLGHEELAVFWALELQTIAPNYVWKRLVIQCSEDIGLADPDAVLTVISLAQGYEFCKQVSRWFVDPEALVHAVMVMCRADKSSDADDLKCLIENRVEAGWRPEVPEYAVDDHTARGREKKKADPNKEEGWGEFYRFRQGYLAQQKELPWHRDQGKYFEKLKQEFPKFVGNVGEKVDPWTLVEKKPDETKD